MTILEPAVAPDLETVMQQFIAHAQAAGGGDVLNHPPVSTIAGVVCVSFSAWCALVAYARMMLIVVGGNAAWCAPVSAAMAHVDPTDPAHWGGVPIAVWQALRTALDPVLLVGGIRFHGLGAL